MTHFTLCNILQLFRTNIKKNKFSIINLSCLVFFFNKPMILTRLKLKVKIYQKKFFFVLCKVLLQKFSKGKIFKDEINKHLQHD